MALPDVVGREEWLAARTALLAKEKALTRAKDELNAERRMLPMVRVEKDYRFTGPDGEVGLADLFAGRRQLVVQHFMFDPSWTDGCSSCTASVDEISDGLLAHLAARDTSFAVVARAPLPVLEDYRSRRGWSLPLYSSAGSTFNVDFHVTIDASAAPVMFNYRGPEALREAGMDWLLDPASQPMEQPGLSCFLRDGDDVFHTYSTFARGTEQLGGVYGLLDLTALGRQEDWEQPAGRASSTRAAVPTFD